MPLLVGHLLRFEPRWIAARQRLEADAIGDVVSVTTRRIGNLLDQEVLRGRTSIPLYYGVHDLDVMRWYAGAEATTITAQKHSGVLRAAGFEIDDVYTAVLAFANGVHGTAELGWHVPANAVAARTSGVTVVGTKGIIRIEQGDTGFECWTEQDSSADSTRRFGWKPTASRVARSAWKSGISPMSCAASRLRLRRTMRSKAFRLALAMEASAVRHETIELGSYGQD